MASTDRKPLLNSHWLNGWNLFWLLAGPICIMKIAVTLRTGLATPADVSSLIGFSVRWAVPLIFLIVAIPALQTLFPGPVPSWLMRNRKQIGLVFALTMAWQGLFIFLISTRYRGYYFEDIHLFRDELEGSIGYVFLALMVLTSFDFGRKRLSPKEWKLLHMSGMYFLWAYALSTYWWAKFYYEGPEPHDRLFYALGFSAMALRIVAWRKRRLNEYRRAGVEFTIDGYRRLLAGLLIGAGLALAVTGRLWGGPYSDFTLGPAWSARLELWLPFWPFDPFISLLMFGLGVACITPARPVTTH